MADGWVTVPMVVIPAAPRATCPFCDCAAFIIVRSMGNQGDGAILRRCVCRRCSERFTVMVDPEADKVKVILASDWQAAASGSVRCK